MPSPRHRRLFPPGDHVHSALPKIQEGQDLNPEALGSYASRFQEGPGPTAWSWGPGRERTKEKAWAVQAFLSGLLKWFPDQDWGLPWTHSRRGCFPGNLWLKASPRAGSAAPPAGGFVYSPDTSKPCCLPQGTRGYHVPPRRPPGAWLVLIFPVVLGSTREQGCDAASFFSCHYTHTSQPSQANPTRTSLCQRKCQPSLPPCCASD